MKKTLTKHLFNLVFGKSVQSERNEKGLRIVISKKSERNEKSWRIAISKQTILLYTLEKLILCQRFTSYWHNKIAGRTSLYQKIYNLLIRFTIYL